MEDEAPLVKLAYAILLSAEKKHATEVRIRRDGPRSVVDFVIDGNVVEEMTPPPRLHPYIVRRMSIMASLPMYGKGEWVEGFIVLQVADRRLGFVIHVEGHGDDVEATLRRVGDADIDARDILRYRMNQARLYLERAQSEPPLDLRAWVWSLAPFGKRVLVAAASAVITPAIEAWQVALQQDPSFAASVGEDLVLRRARDAVEAWLHAPDRKTTAQVHAVRPPLDSFVERVRVIADELSGDGDLHRRAATMARCVDLAVRATTWSEDDARRDAAGDAAEHAKRLETGPAFEAAEAVALYAVTCPEDRGSIAGWITQASLRIL